MGWAIALHRGKHFYGLGYGTTQGEALVWIGLLHYTGGSTGVGWPVARMCIESNCITGSCTKKQGIELNWIKLIAAHKSCVGYTVV